MNNEKARNIHAMAENSRESGNFLGALQLIDEATIKYQEEQDLLGMAEVQGSRYLTFVHLYNKTNINSYMILALHSAMSAVEIAKESGNQNALALPTYNLGKCLEDMAKYSEAIPYYNEAIKYMSNFPPEPHNKEATLGDMNAHLAYCEYKSGDKSALERLINAISQLQQLTFDPYTKDVWISGAHMRIAEMLREDNKELAQQHLNNAKEIIDANPKLTLRRGQWEKIIEPILILLLQIDQYLHQALLLYLKFQHLSLNL